MFTKAAEYMKKGISYPSDLLSFVAMAAMAYVTLAVTVDVFFQKVFHSPIYGLWDTCMFAFAVIIWGPMVLTALKGSHIALTFLLDKFPRLPRLCLQLIITLVTSGILGLTSWQVLLYGIHLQETKMGSPTLNIPYAPLAYFIAISCFIMGLAFLIKFPETIGEIRREQ